MKTIDVRLNLPDGFDLKIIKISVTNTTQCPFHADMDHFRILGQAAPLASIEPPHECPHPGTCRLANECMGETEVATLAVEPVRWLMSYRGVSALDICHLPDVTHSEKRAIEVVNQVKRAGRNAWYEALYTHSVQPVAALQVARQWQPIQTAPRDGTHILIKLGNTLPATCHWFDGGWHLSVNQRGEYSAWIWGEPTHWMELPTDATPPEAKGVPAYEAMRKVLTDAVKYLDGSVHNQISSHSNLHNQMRDAITTPPLIDEGSTSDKIDEYRIVARDAKLNLVDAQNEISNLTESLAHADARATAAEENLERLKYEIQGQTFMGEPVIARPQSSEPTGDQAE